MPRLASRLGCTRFSANLVIPAGRGDDEALAVHYEEVGAVLAEVMEAAERHNVRFMWYSPTPVCLFNTLSHGLGNKGCAACDGLLSVDPRGNLLPCSSWNEPVGNLLEDDFQRLWNGRKARRLREKAHAHPRCRDCEHFPLCQGACPLYFRAHGYGEIERALRSLGGGLSKHRPVPGTLATAHARGRAS
jgi:radical SAM protein with 4Fe4S-binding SPASM domain